MDTRVLGSLKRYVVTATTSVVIKSSKSGAADNKEWGLSVSGEKRADISDNIFGRGNDKKKGGGRERLVPSKWKTPKMAGRSEVAKKKSGPRVPLDEGFYVGNRKEKRPPKKTTLSSLIRKGRYARRKGGKGECTQLRESQSCNALGGNHATKRKRKSLSTNTIKREGTAVRKR